MVGRQKAGLIVGFVAATIANSSVLDAQERAPTLRWVAATGGAIPADAIPCGRDAYGTREFACRGVIRRGMHVGRIASGFGGCQIGYGNREFTLPDYEVLVRAPPTVAAAVTAKQRAIGGATRAVGDPAGSATRVQPPSVPSATTPVVGRAKRGFDDKGRPYIEERLADGSIQRIQQNGTTITKPDGTKHVSPMRAVRAGAQRPTQPELPNDTRWMGWLSWHNDRLLDLISTLVERNAAELTRFSDLEREEVGANLLSRISYRTQIAEFLAQE